MSKEATKTRYNDEELAEFDRIIIKKIASSQSQLDFYLQQLSDMASNDDTKVRGLDDGLSTAEAERISAMAGRVKKHISHLENARIRIKNKTYGICRESSKLISKERLKAVPHATLSIAAKQSRVVRR